MAYATPVIVGNWKMHGLRDEGEALARALARDLAATPFAGTMIACPPTTALDAVRQALGDSGIGLGAQDCHSQDQGAFTGSISAPMIRDSGCGYCIVGHSERRHGLAESDALIADKAIAAQRHDLTPIICIGETEEQYRAGKTLDMLNEQIEASVSTALDPSQLLIAYEPVWAIGTGLTPSVDDIQNTHAHIKQRLAIRFADEPIPLLYGGSVKPGNAKEILALEAVDGVLVGGASLKADDFLAIARAKG